MSQQDIIVFYGDEDAESVKRLLRRSREWDPIKVGYHSQAYRMPDGEGIFKVTHKLSPFTSYEEAAWRALRLETTARRLQTIGLRIAFPSLIAIQRVVTGRQRRNSERPDTWCLLTREKDGGEDHEDKLRKTNIVDAWGLVGEMLLAIDTLASQDVSEYAALYRPPYPLILPFGKVLESGGEFKPANFAGHLFVDLFPVKEYDEETGIPEVEHPQPPVESRNFALAWWRSYTVAGIMLSVLAGSAKVRTDLTLDIMGQGLNFSGKYGLTSFLENQPAWQLIQAVNHKQRRAILEELTMEDPYGARMTALAIAQKILLNRKKPLGSEESALERLHKDLIEPTFADTRFIDIRQRTQKEDEALLISLTGKMREFVKLI